MSAPQVPQHTRSGPVFVVGCARSGTSLTCRLLLDHLGVNFGTESQFIIRYSRRLPSYGDLSVNVNMRRLLTDISGERFFMRTRRNFGFVFDIDRALQSPPEPTYAGALDAIFGQFASAKGRARWGDKTPEYNDHLDRLLALFPTAQFLHVVRDPRDVVLSHFAAGFGSRNAHDTAVHWREAVNRVCMFGARLPEDQFMQVSYEELISRPAGTLDRVAQFLGIEDHTALITGLEDRLKDQVRPGQANKWQSRIARRELECIETVARVEMRELGYATVTPAAMQIGRLELARWRARGMWRRLCDRRFWKDSVYRIGLRARPVLRLARSVTRAVVPLPEVHDTSVKNTRHEVRS